MSIHGVFVVVMTLCIKDESVVIQGIPAELV